LAGARLGWRSVGVSVLLHVAVVGAVVVWTPVKVAQDRPIYEVEIVTAPPLIAFSSQPAAASLQKAEPPPQPPEPRKEIPPPAMVAEKTPPQSLPMPAVNIPSPLHIAVVAAPRSMSPATDSASTNTLKVAQRAKSSDGAEEVTDPAYVNSVRAAVARKLRYPEPALRRGIEGRVVLRVLLDATGRLLDTAPGVPAADSALTAAALAAVQHAAPFPPWPGAHLQHATLCLTLPIRFKLDEK
jgi:protein TonB